ncbi:MAG: subfamily peptidase [Candidatus Peribacteria bacterium]|nr:subfamily peptidase [Candidatus Peribacteria bacterium]
MGFRIQPLYRRRQVSIVSYLSRKFAFWTAMFSLFAFIIGNQVGHYGVNVFMRSVFGDVDNSLIAYDGTVSPLRVPDYSRLAQYGTSLTYDMVPPDAYKDLPLYDPVEQRKGNQASIYSIGYMGSYATGADGTGSHPGVDIRALAGTPVVSSMKGLIVRVAYEKGGFGNYIVVKTAFAPDPNDRSRTTTLYATYAHLSETSVTEGTIVEKGRMIGKVGATGFATGNHLHFQIGRDSMRNGYPVSQPSWPFTAKEAGDAGLSYTEAVDAGLYQERGYAENVSPVLYVQAHYAASGNQTVAVSGNQSSSVAIKKLTAAELRDERLKARVAKNSIVAVRTPVTLQTVVAYNDEPFIVAPASASSAASVSSSSAASVSGTAKNKYSTIELRTDGLETSRREWKTIELVFVDESGKTVARPALAKDLYLRTAYGEAEFKPARITEADAASGRVKVQVLGFSNTVVLQIQPLGLILTSVPLQFAKN